MQALRVRQPFASFIVSEAKQIENRSRAFSVRGRILIHGSVSNVRYRTKSPNAVHCLPDLPTVRAPVTRLLQQLLPPPPRDRGRGAH